jgi:hypothetical protein
MMPFLPEIDSITKLPDGCFVVGIIDFKGRLIVATSLAVFELVDNKLVQILFDDASTK